MSPYAHALLVHKVMSLGQEVPDEGTLQNG
jgi:hypothetical protein